ncbi:unnamed protein product [Ambrosiozyma monospora]|uniref:Unnamed protein product n=1 Tax=Ambrosiozyma monospora TaxID=43982 RepID=A0ACB5T5W1_AMBMO|nr:unnamed protein product [Ambrosiozyma monospora]
MDNMLKCYNKNLSKSSFFTKDDIICFAKQYVNGELELGEFMNKAITTGTQNLPSSEDIQKTTLLIIAVLFLQFFIQSNFTGPKIPFDSENGLPEFGFVNVIVKAALSNDKFRQNLHTTTLKALSVGGQQPYNLSDSPVFLVFSLRILEFLQGSGLSLLDESASTSEPEAAVSASNIPSSSLNQETDVVTASICWWRSRALQVQQSLFHDSSAVLTSISSALLTSELVSTFIDHSNLNSDMNQGLLLIFHLESSKNALAADIDSKVSESLVKAAKVSGLQFILTGCKAKRTKYQQKAIAALTVLAKSQDSLLKLYDPETSLAPTDVKLNDDLFLERPQYESLGNDELFQLNNKPDNDDDQDYDYQSGEIKRIKIDYSKYDSCSSGPEKTLLPIAPKEEDIPKELTELNPNEQPALANLDNIQLILRLEAIKASIG